MFEMLLTLFAQHAYAIVFMAVVLDHAGLPIPGELLLLMFGALVRSGDLDPVLGVSIATGAALSGDGIGYWVGRLTGERVLRLYCRLTLGSGRCVRKAVAYYQLHGRMTIIFGRFVMGARAFLSPLAGSAGMPFGQFLLFDALGALVWSGLFIGLGYALGWGPEEAEQGIHGMSIALWMVVGVGLITFLVVKRLRRAHHGVAVLSAGGIARVARNLNIEPSFRKESKTCVPISQEHS